MLKPRSIRLDLAAQPILWLDVERRKADLEPAMSTILHEGELVTYVHDERLRPAAESSGGGNLATYRSWAETVEEILGAADQGALIGGYSQAELKLLKEARPSQVEGPNTGSGRTIGSLNQNLPERDQRSRGDMWAR